jgi:hypothetical protein
MPGISWSGTSGAIHHNNGGLPVPIMECPVFQTLCFFAAPEKPYVLISREDPFFPGEYYR